MITKFVMISYIGSKYFAETTLVSFLSSSKFSIFMFFSGVREWSQAGYQPMIYPMMMMVPCPQVKVILLALVKNFLCQIDCVELALTIFIGPESDHCLPLSVTHSLTHSLTDSCLVNLIDVTLACEDAYSKLEVVTVAGVGDEDCIGNSLMQIWKLRFGHM